MLISEDTAADLAVKLTQTLRSTSHLARATALEMLLSLYARHRKSVIISRSICHDLSNSPSGNSKPRLIESAIPEIVGLALDDKHNDIWKPAFRLLVALSSPLGGEQRDNPCTVAALEGQVTGGKAQIDAPGRRPYPNLVSKEVKSQMSKFMALLEHQDMRPLVIDLLSFLSVDAKGELRPRTPCVQA